MAKHDPFLHGARGIDAQCLETIGERLKILRLALGYDEKTMARLIGITLATYRKYEAGSEIRKWSSVVHFCGNHDIWIDWLMMGDGRCLRKVGTGKVAILSTSTPQIREWREMAQGLKLRTRLGGADQAECHLTKILLRVWAGGRGLRS
jgi:transcriptional regulator with XRE-family HTH domain